MNVSAKLPLSLLLAQIMIFAYVAIIGAVTPLTIASQIFGITYRVYSVLSLVLVILALGTVVWFSRPFWLQVTERDYLNIALLSVVGIAVVLLTLWTNRPDGDEMYYIPNARYFAQNPDTPMDFAIHFLYPDGPIIVSRSSQTSMPYDYLRVVVAEAFQLDFFIVYYTLSSAIAAFMIPLTYYFLISRFTDSPRLALVGTVAAVALLLILIDAHQTFGNQAFPRIYQGKSIQMVMALPAFAAFGITVLLGREHLLYYWAAAFATCLAGLGMTATSIPSFPVLAVGLVAGAFMLSPAEKLSRAGIRETAGRTAGLALTMTYLVAYALYLRANQTFEFGIGSRMAYGFPTDYLATVMTFFNPENPRTPIAVAISLIFGFLLITGESRRYLAGWFAAITIAFLNPIVAPFLIDKIATPNAFYRMFYAYPFPLIGALLVVELYRRWGVRLHQGVRFAAVALVFGLSVGSYLVDEAKAGYLEWAPVKYYSLPSLELAEEIVAAAPPGVILTPLPDPLSLYGTIPVVDPDYPTMLVRGDTFWVWIPELHARGLRENAALFAGGLLKHRGEFDQVMAFYPIRTVVLAKQVYEFPSVPAILDGHGLTQSAYVGNYVVVWKP